MSASGSPVAVGDVAPPTAPPQPLDSLVSYLTERFPQRKGEYLRLIGQAKQLRNKEDVVQLGYETIEFRFELIEWVNYAARILNDLLGDEMARANEELTSAASETAGAPRRASAKLVETQAKQMVAPVRRAYDELKETRDFLTNILFWCQAQQRIIAADEYGDMFAANNEVPDELEMTVVSPPSVAPELQRIAASR